ncbi:MAG TPA: GGDEF domain-containing protein [Planctomycetota bacterium]
MRRFLECFVLLAALPAVAGGYFHFRGGGPIPTALAGYGVFLSLVASWLICRRAETRALAELAADRERETKSNREELQGRVDLLTAQREISLVLNEDVDFRAVLERVLGIAGDLLGGDLELWGRSGEKLVLRASRRNGVVEFDVPGAADVAVRRCFEEGKADIGLAPLMADREIIGVARASAGWLTVPELAKFLALALKTPDLYTRAVQDGLTGLWTKRHFLTQIGELIENARRYGEPLTIVMVDIDHFKKVNDTHGHQTGDKVLKGVAEILKNKVRGGMAFRYGGEEMAILMPKAAADEAAGAAERLRKAIEGRKISGVAVTASFGVAQLDVAMKSGDDLVERADQALYRAKEGGRNRVERASRTEAPAVETRRWRRGA